MALALVFAMAVPALAHQVSYFAQGAGGSVWGQWAQQYPSTYDGDGIIAAKVDDALTDGSCVSAIYRDGGSTYNQATSCSSWVNHLFYDQTGNSSSEVRVNRSYPDTLVWVHISGY